MKKAVVLLSGGLDSTVCMSEEGFKNSLVPQIDVAQAAGYSSLVFVPGKIGEDIAVSQGLPKEAIVQTSNFIGFMLEAAAERKVKNVLLLGHIGKLVKVAAGIFYTHNRIADGRLETLAAYAAAEGLPPDGVRQVLAAATTEAALPVLEEYGLQRVYDQLAAQASRRIERYVFQKLQAGTVMLRHKSPDTPVGIVNSASREQQSVVISTLQDFTKEEIHMFSLVIIGNSRTYVKEGYMITPRGYEL